jgi:hypothetical protein
MTPMVRSVRPVRPARPAAVSVIAVVVGSYCWTSLVSWVAWACRKNWSVLTAVWQL